VAQAAKPRAMSPEPFMSGLNPVWQTPRPQYTYVHLII